ncbi:hypothetical protein BD626DRAFT_586550 [Schizophyllum amplum]|uniref:Uncharacterized protein n=1 Tax=Schizophyllum amplum TaxID=97359 RepID=A0A550BYM1_9AGAR|nr:hypothetical protein BD626DRAFT_586550 [Auriculariopsis ampla]
MSVSKIGQKFRAAGLYNVSSPVPYRSLYPTLLQDLFDCLNSTPLPTPPFDESSIALLSEGIDAMQIYACIFGNVTGHPPTFHDMLLKRLPSVWKWISFQNPLNGNMIDDVRAGDTLNGACQLQDGQLAMPLVHRMMGIVMFLGPLLASPRSVRALADIPSIVDDLLGILVADSQPSVYSMQHRYFFVFHQLLYDADPAVSRRFREGMESFDERYPGQLVWILSGRLLWFFDRRHEAHDDASFAVVYSKVLTPEFLNNRRTVANLRASALSPVVHACSCITKAMTSFPTFDSSGTNSWVSGPPHKHLAIALWLRLLAALLLTQDPYARAAHSDVILAVRCGLLWVVQSILSASMSLVPQAARTHAGSYQADLARIVMYAMGPAMVWPDCLRVLKECVSRALPLDAASAHTVGHPLWSALSTRYEDLRRAKADYRNDVQNRYICGHVSDFSARPLHSSPI